MFMQNIPASFFFLFVSLGSLALPFSPFFRAFSNEQGSRTHECLLGSFRMQARAHQGCREAELELVADPVGEVFLEGYGRPKTGLERVFVSRRVKCLRDVTLKLQVVNA
ncbi:hypothetical protein DFH27DRAFT_599429 [Peziza echinospora]|nr:hypothetical protein DFH27DRAFT_599429 [Peziza echinospora]